MGNFYADLSDPPEKWQRAEYVYAVIIILITNKTIDKKSSHNPYM